MLIKDWMNPKVITIDANNSMHDAIRMIKEHGISMLPVVKKGELVGIVTDRDLKRASASDATTLEVHELLYLISKIKVSDIMSKNPITIPFDYTIEEAAELMLKHKISGLPVTDHEGNLVGTITKTDVFKCIISLTGIGTRGIQFAFLLEDRPGSIKEVADVLRSYGGRMVSILTTYERVPEGFRKAFIRMFGVKRELLPNLLEDLRKKAKVLYMVDHRANRREIYED
ncbi:MAG: CBS and ACT domain-containing protein [Desulfatiglandales bacterium]